MFMTKRLRLIPARRSHKKKGWLRRTTLTRNYPESESLLDNDVNWIAPRATDNHRQLNIPGARKLGRQHHGDLIEPGQHTLRTGILDRQHDCCTAAGARLNFDRLRKVRQHLAVRQQDIVAEICVDESRADARCEERNTRPGV